MAAIWRSVCVLSVYFTSEVWLAYGLYLVGIASPGPSNLAIASTALRWGRISAMQYALGVITGSVFWGVVAVMGLAPLLFISAHFLWLTKLLGGCYLLWLAFKSARSAINMSVPESPCAIDVFPSALETYASGVVVHLTNPKAVFVWISIAAVALPAQYPMGIAWAFLTGCTVLAVVVFTGYAWLFSSQTMQRVYKRLNVWFEAVVALLFGYAGVLLIFSPVDD